MKNLKKLREKRNINQLKMAVDLELTQEAVSKYETGKAKPSCAVLVKLADYLNCSTDFLLNRTNNPKINNEKVDNENEKIDNFLFRYKKLSVENKNRLDGYLKALENEQDKKK